MPVCWRVHHSCEKLGSFFFNSAPHLNLYVNQNNLLAISLLLSIAIFKAFIKLILLYPIILPIIAPRRKAPAAAVANAKSKRYTKSINKAKA